MPIARQLAFFLSLFSTAALAACSGPSGKTDRSNDAASANEAAASSGPAGPRPVTAAGPAKIAATAQALDSKTDTLDFSYAWPAAAAAIPALDAWLRANGEKLRRESGSDAEADKGHSARDGYAFHTHSYDESFAVVADTPRMLVLLSEGYVFTGGAHGMPINTAILWDRATGRRLATATLVSIPRIAELTRKRFCAALDAQRAQKRGGPVRHDDPNQINGFVDCVDMTKQLLLPVATGGAALDTLRVVIGPYEAGPYVEGSYVIDLPFDTAMLATVKPPYRDAFGPAR